MGVLVFESRKGLFFTRGLLVLDLDSRDEFVFSRAMMGERELFS